MQLNSSSNKHPRKNHKILLWSTGVICTLFSASMAKEYWQARTQSSSLLTKAAVSEWCHQVDCPRTLPMEMTFPVSGRAPASEAEAMLVQYSLDWSLQARMAELFEEYQPDFGAFAAVDPRTGRVLALVSYSRKSEEENLALRASFPSASVFKVVTAAAMADSKYSAETVIPFQGSNHTLYKNHILKERHNRWTRYMTLRQAFAQSVNTVFGKIGAFSIGAERLRDYAWRFGFNRDVGADFPVQTGRAEFEDNAWALAEAASGYTRDTRMSPLQGALIAAAVVNQGTMMEPYLVESLHAKGGQPLYQVEPRVSSRAMSPEVAAEMRTLMRETVTSGTSRKWFRGFFKGNMADLDVGGKTGSLTGDEPKGKYDWFVGYADSGKDQIAIAALTVNQRVWRVKSSYLARQAIEARFKHNRVAQAEKR